MKGTIKEIQIYPLGGISKFWIAYNISPWKELLIILAGPLFQWFAFFLLLLFLPNRIDMIQTYHFQILFFNLLPIYPLDGGKLLFLFFQTFLSWKKSLKLSILMGYFFLFCFLFQPWKWNLLIMMILLFILLIKEQRQVSYQYQKFLLERYLYSYSFAKTKMIRGIQEFYRNRKHLIREEGKYYWEKEYLEKHLKKD